MYHQATLRNRLKWAVASKKLIKAFRCCIGEYHRRGEEAKYLARVFWLSLKYKIILSIELKRKGKTFFDREIRLARNCLTFQSTRVELQSHEAKLTLVAFVRHNFAIKGMRNLLTETMRRCFTCTEKARIYFKIKRA
jgi:hypothetical protein